MYVLHYQRNQVTNYFFLFFTVRLRYFLDSVSFSSMMEVEHIKVVKLIQKFIMAAKIAALNFSDSLAQLFNSNLPVLLHSCQVQRHSSEDTISYLTLTASLQQRSMLLLPYCHFHICAHLLD